MERCLTEQNQNLQAIVACLTGQQIKNGGNLAHISGYGGNLNQISAPQMQSFDFPVPLVPVAGEESDSFRVVGSENGRNHNLSREFLFKGESYGSTVNQLGNEKLNENQNEIVSKNHCVHCGQICSNKKTLRNHLSKFHSAVKNVLKPSGAGIKKPNAKKISEFFPKPETSTESLGPCQSSSSYLNHQRWMNMKQHLIEIDGKRFYRCPLCKNTIANRKTNFIRHLLTKHKIPATELAIDSVQVAAAAETAENTLN